MKAVLDLSGLRDLEKDLTKLESKHVEWGFLSGEHSTAEMSYAELAWMLEDGTDKIPPRPAFRDMIAGLITSHKAFEYEIKDEMQRLVYGMGNPYNVHKASGEYLKALYTDTMVSWFSDGSMNRQNSKVTKAIKGHAMPYVWTGELVQNVEYQIT
ncbi:MAG: hypothetical protein CMF22_10060 [Idiomarinaceae bacterium]|nr:hypothetical protein [Idiomarinaceae bacterium]MBG23785.1 hypothetical protein [Idiomarinaceae bacterium]|tara:strand:+ start:56015 stop:56479 length:465 start_codon:yes stop_codon:yes gene_type:complete